MSVIEHQSPVGPLTLVGCEAGLGAVYFVGHKATVVPHAKGPETTVLAQTRRELDAYFAGRLQLFTVPLAPTGTAFQLKVWALLAGIGFGEQRTYGDLARSLGQPSAARAVGAAVGRNPLSIIVPCHRVVGASGALTGFAGGLERKAKLLELEAAALRGMTQTTQPRGG